MSDFTAGRGSQQRFRLSKRRLDYARPVREHWTLDPDLVYLNHGSFGAVPEVTQRAQQRLQAEAESNPMRWFREVGQRLVHVRDTIGRYLGVSGGEIALVPNASTGVNIALRSIPARPGQSYVLTSHAYGAVRIAAQRIAAERGCGVDVVDLALDASDDEVLAAVEATLDGRPRGSVAALVIDQVTSATAKLLPVDRVIDVGRARGIPVVVDGAHAPGLVDSPVVGDFWAGNLHKWPCAPRGTGVLYVAPSRRADVVPPTISWWDALGFPVALDQPGTIDSTGWLAAPTSLDLLDSLGFDEHRKDLEEMLCAGVETVAGAIGGRPLNVGRPAPTMRLVSLPGDLAWDDLKTNRLAGYIGSRSGVEVAVANWAGHGFLRLSAHLYNTPEDYVTAATRWEPLFADHERLREIVSA